ncbi:unnamed protein product [Cyprideis torosa]|uniref:Uncharacterized protein n=1 Tax=Cyprideis torosa TaxID=163714 RepID=A0A7R8ZR77_9CRUS|nr:unnamed protein product [Cyprideis torosa]CAG0898246.1 unnamed protein product [Cyprideis torosa]
MSHFNLEEGSVSKVEEKERFKNFEVMSVLAMLAIASLVPGGTRLYSSSRRNARYNGNELFCYWIPPSPGPGENTDVVIILRLKANRAL